MEKNNKVLIIGSRTDPVIRFFARSIAPRIQRKNFFYFVDHDQFGKGVQLDDKKWTLPSGHQIAHNQVAGVWNRMVSTRGSENNIVSQMEIFSSYLMNDIYHNVLNRPNDGMSNYAKLYQLDLLELKRLRRVESVMFANGAMCMPARAASHIYKSASGVRSVVREVIKSDRHRWVREPVLFQPNIIGINIRVHVIGSRAIACICDSEAIDYRYANAVKLKRLNLPKWLEKECIHISQQLRLVFAGIDLIQRDNQFFLLEVNPAPGYAFFDLDASISNALADFFINTSEMSSH